MGKTPVREIVMHAATVFGVRTADIYGPAHFQRFSRPRQAVYWIAREQGWSKSSIGRTLARDRRTVAYGAINASEIAKRDRLYRERCARVRQFAEAAA